MHPSGSSVQESKIESGANQLNGGSSSIQFTIETSFGSAAVADAIPPEDYEQFKLWSSQMVEIQNVPLIGAEMPEHVVAAGTALSGSSR